MCIISHHYFILIILCRSYILYEDDSRGKSLNHSFCNWINDILALNVLQWNDETLGGGTFRFMTHFVILVSCCVILCNNCVHEPVQHATTTVSYSSLEFHLGIPGYMNWCIILLPGCDIPITLNKYNLSRVWCIDSNNVAIYFLNKWRCLFTGKLIIILRWKGSKGFICDSPYYHNKSGMSVNPRQLVPLFSAGECLIW